ncbi:Dps family protein [Mucilaginibacter sp. OK283]|jgi:starvation-inducible DNA-binding protein|uniref:Dps family protein n=1 Tax=Mucilaginibacter sp. OK283 TaxID=1881049 RepID=UPI0008C8C81E|nr:DNA starvation/stationary phase protection protein [Mucilaginibacter sp. OK283]SEO10420.1 starvation-inducible DNA-binding protein [Mucilaginibacter sp. OK283]
MKMNIGISEANTQKVVNELSKLLADEFILFTKTKNAHWNLEGTDFHGLHVFFEEQFTQLDEIVDSIAERIRSLGHFSLASLKEFLDHTRLSEKIEGDNSGASYIKNLLEDHKSIIFTLRANIDTFASEYKDYGSSDFLTGLISAHEKMAWMLGSHLKK